MAKNTDAKWTPADHLFFPKFDQPTQDQTIIRDRFIDELKAEYGEGMKIEYIGRIPITLILKSLGKTCSALKASYPKEAVRIALKDIYLKCGIRITPSGDLQFNQD